VGGSHHDTWLVVEKLVGNLVVLLLSIESSIVLCFSFVPFFKGQAMCDSDVCIPLFS